MASIDPTFLVMKLAQQVQQPVPVSTTAIKAPAYLAINNIMHNIMHMHTCPQVLGRPKGACPKVIETAALVLARNARTVLDTLRNLSIHNGYFLPTTKMSRLLNDGGVMWKSTRFM
jgi:hypothetical protein